MKARPTVIQEMWPGHSNFLAISHFITYVVISTFGFFISINQILNFFNDSANAAESDKRDLMKELDTMKQLKPHPYVIKLLGCVTESGMLWLCGSNFFVHILLIIYFVTLSCH